MDSLKKAFSNSSSSGRPRLERVNAIRNADFVAPESTAVPHLPQADEDLFRLYGGHHNEESVENLLHILNISRPDMLGIPAAAWEARMSQSRPASGELFYDRHPEEESSDTTDASDPMSLPSAHSTSASGHRPALRRRSLDTHLERLRRNSFETVQRGSNDFEREKSVFTSGIGILDNQRPRETSANMPSTELRIFANNALDVNTQLVRLRPSRLGLTEEQQTSGLRWNGENGTSLGETKIRSINLQSSDDGSFTADSMSSHSSESMGSYCSSLNEGDEHVMTTVPAKVVWSSWRKLELLGSGSFGMVYKGVSSDGVFFAVKEVSLLNQGSSTEQSVLQLEQEIAVLSDCQHQNIVQYLGTEREQDKLYIFLELVTQGSLASLYKKYPLFDRQIRNYTRHILNGLHYLHGRNCVHRDIKCANILVHADGMVKLADFGMAKELQNIDSMRSCKGSAYWMAPEVIDPRKTAGLPTDIWSLGCTVLEMATGQPPFSDWPWQTVMWKVGHGELPPIPESLPEDARDFISQCLQVDPSSRPTAAMLLRHPFLSNLTERSSSTPLLVNDAKPISEDLLGSSTRIDSLGSLGSRSPARSVRTRHSVFRSHSTES